MKQTVPHRINSVTVCRIKQVASKPRQPRYLGTHFGSILTKIGMVFSLGTVTVLTCQSQATAARPVLNSDLFTASTSSLLRSSDLGSNSDSSFFALPNPSESAVNLSPESPLVASSDLRGLDFSQLDQANNTSDLEQSTAKLAVADPASLAVIESDLVPSTSVESFSPISNDQPEMRKIMLSLPTLDDQAHSDLTVAEPNAQTEPLGLAVSTTSDLRIADLKLADSELSRETTAEEMAVKPEDKSSIPAAEVNNTLAIGGGGLAPTPTGLKEATKAQTEPVQPQSQTIAQVPVAAAPDQQPAVNLARGTDLYVPVAKRAVFPQLPQMDLPPLASADTYLPDSAGSQISTTGTLKYISPARGMLTSGYGWRWGRMHRGIDIASAVGTTVMASAPGVVVTAGWNSGGYGNLVEVRHTDGSLTVYAHNNKIVARTGQQIQQGQKISEMGSTGRSTGPHVHFEIHPQGKGAVNPMTFLSRS